MKFKIAATTTIITSILLLSGCATTKQYKTKLNSWNNQNINQFVSAWGYPDSTMKMPNGNTVYIYKTNQTTHFPEYKTGGYTTVQTSGSNTTITQVPSVSTGGGTYNYKCTTWVEFNKNNIITRTSFRGNSCVA
jgi:hypothetical protein